MAKKQIINQVDQQEFSDDLLQRKLTGVFGEHRIEIPWHLYEKYANYVADHLVEEGLTINKIDVLENQEIAEEFLQAAIQEVTQYLSWEDVHDRSYEVAMRVFSKAIKEERERARMVELEEEKVSAQARKIALEAGQHIVVDPKHEKRARAILMAAGLLK